MKTTQQKEKDNSDNRKIQKEWKIIFYEDEKGCPVKEFIEKLKEPDRKK